MDCFVRARVCVAIQMQLRGARACNAGDFLPAWGGRGKHPGMPVRAEGVEVYGDRGNLSVLQPAERKCSVFLWVWSVMANLKEGVQFYVCVMECTCIQALKIYE